MTQPLAPGGAERAASVAPPTDFLDGFISEEEYAARNVSTTLRQLVLEFRLVLAPFSWAG